MAVMMILMALMMMKMRLVSQIGRTRVVQRMVSVEEEEIMKLVIVMIVIMMMMIMMMMMMMHLVMQAESIGFALQMVNIKKVLVVAV